MSNTLVSVTALSALGKLRKEDLLVLIAQEYKEGVEREKKLVEMKIESLRVTQKKAEADLEAAKTNLTRDCESSLALDNGFRNLSNQMLSVLEPSSFFPANLPSSANPVFSVVSRRVDIYTARVDVQLFLRIPCKPGPAEPQGDSAVDLSLTFHFPVPANITNLLEAVRKSEEEINKLKATLNRLSVLGGNCHEFAKKELAKARLAASAGAESVLDKSLLANWIHANLTP